MFLSHVLNDLMTDLSKAFAGTSKLEKVLDIWTAGKLFYTLSTWGLALAGYHSLPETVDCFKLFFT